MTNTLGRRRERAENEDCDYSGQSVVEDQDSRLSLGEDNLITPTREPNGSRAIVLQNVDKEAHEVRLFNERSEF